MNNNRTTYLVIGGVVVLILVIGLIIYMITHKKATPAPVVQDTSTIFGTPLPETDGITRGASTTTPEEDGADVFGNGPLVQFDISSPVVQSGKTATLTWSSPDAESCSAGGSQDTWFFTGNANIGEVETSSITRDTTFTLVCAGKDGSITTKRVIAALPPPTTTTLSRTATTSGSKSGSTQSTIGTSPVHTYTRATSSTPLGVSSTPSGWGTSGGLAVTTTRTSTTTTNWRVNPNARSTSTQSTTSTIPDLSTLATTRATSTGITGATTGIGYNPSTWDTLVTNLRGTVSTLANRIGAIVGGSVEAVAVGGEDPDHPDIIHSGFTGTVDYQSTGLKKCRTGEEADWGRNYNRRNLGTSGTLETGVFDNKNGTSSKIVTLSLICEDEKGNELTATTKFTVTAPVRFTVSVPETDRSIYDSASTPLAIIPGIEPAAVWGYFRNPPKTTIQIDHANATGCYVKGFDQDKGTQIPGFDGQTENTPGNILLDYSSYDTLEAAGVRKFEYTVFCRGGNTPRQIRNLNDYLNLNGAILDPQDSPPQKILVEIHPYRLVQYGSRTGLSNIQDHFGQYFTYYNGFHGSTRGQSCWDWLITMRRAPVAGSPYIRYGSTERRTHTARSATHHTSAPSKNYGCAYDAANGVVYNYKDPRPEGVNYPFLSSAGSNANENYTFDNYWLAY